MPSSINRRAAEIETGDIIIVAGMPYVRRVDSVGIDIAAYDGQNGLRKNEQGIRIKGDHIYPDGRPFGDVRGWQTLCHGERVFEVLS